MSQVAPPQLGVVGVLEGVIDDALVGVCLLERAR